MNTLTTEQKARVFVMHLGQQVITASESEPNEDGDTIPAGAIGKLTLVNIGNLDIRCSDDSENWNLGVDFPSCSYADWISNGLFKLLLRPLSAITDEDALEVAKYEVSGTGFEHDNLRYLRIQVNRDHKECVIYAEYAGRGKTVHPYNLSPSSWQFLIQRGYAVPLFIAPGHPLNGKTAIELGLAIDSTGRPDAMGGLGV